MNRRIANKLKKMTQPREFTLQEAWDRVAAHLNEVGPRTAMFFVDRNTDFRANVDRLELYSNNKKGILISCPMPSTKWTVDDLPWYEDEKEEEETFLCHRCKENESTYDGEMCNECQELQDAEDMKASKEQEKEYWDSKL